MKTVTIFDNLVNMELTVYVGHNAIENWQIIDISKPNDLWFHLQDMPSSHVVLSIPSNIKKVSKQTINKCALLCKEHSKMANYKNIKVIYTDIRNIKKSTEIGSVITKKTTTIII